MSGKGRRVLLTPALDLVHEVLVDLLTHIHLFNEGTGNRRDATCRFHTSMEQPHDYAFPLGFNHSGSQVAVACNDRHMSDETLCTQQGDV